MRKKLETDTAITVCSSTLGWEITGGTNYNKGETVGQDIIDLLSVAASNEIPTIRYQRYLRGKYRHSHKGHSKRRHAIRQPADAVTTGTGVKTCDLLIQELLSWSPDAFDGIPAADIPKTVKGFFEASCADVRRISGISYQKILNLYT